MQFQTAQELDKIADLLKESDFDRGDYEWSPQGGSFSLQTSRRPSGQSKTAGLLRRGTQEWIPCRLVFKHVRSISMWEEYDAPPAPGLIQVESGQGGFKVTLSSLHNLRVELQTGRLEGSLEDS